MAEPDALELCAKRALTTPGFASATLYAHSLPELKEAPMVRAIIQYEAEPDAERYADHVSEFVTKVDCSAFRHGRIFGSPFGEPSARYYAEFEWDDMEAFKAAANSEAFAASGRDAMAMGIPFTVHFASIE